MSAFGKDEEFKAKLSDLMIERAAEIGDWSMVREVSEVTAHHIECCRQPDAVVAADELKVECAHEHGYRTLDPRDGLWHCVTCGAVMPS